MRCPVCHRRLESSTAPACVIHGLLDPPSSHGAPVVRVADLPLPVLAGYSQLTPLGKGGLSRVYRAQASQGNEVVLKVASTDNPQAMAGLEHEVQVLRRVVPAAVPSVFELRREGDCAFMAMERVSGMTLAEVLAKRAERFSMAEVREGGWRF